MNALIVILAFVILACTKIKAASLDAWQQAQNKASELATNQPTKQPNKKGGRHGK